MWLVRIALLRPYTFIVLALVMLLLGIISIFNTEKDVLPAIGIPVVSIVWNYAGMPPDDMANRITNIFERAVTSTVTNIEHLESASLFGVNVVKIFFQPDVNIAIAISEVSAIAQTVLKAMPPGIMPPLILSYDASTVPVMQLILSSDSLPEQALNDLGTNFIRVQLATIQGVALPWPYGGKVRQVQLDLDSKAMQAYHVSPQIIQEVLAAQNPIIPAGSVKIGDYQYMVLLNSSPHSIDEFNYLPVKATSNELLFLRDVAHVRDGFAPQTNLVRVNDVASVMLPIQKTGHSSTLTVINRVKALLPLIKDSMPDALRVGIIGDQSIFVLGAIKGVIIEALVAALLTGSMILLFLGSMRSTFIIMVSIPLSMLTSLVCLALCGQTINIMTLGGLALAVGILVDDATVTLENINWNLEQGKNLRQAILDGAAQIATPALVSTLAICIVFIPMFFLTGVAKYLFVPLAEAVIFAMLTSYFLSRTLVPTLAAYWLTPTAPAFSKQHAVHTRFNEYFLRLREIYHKKLTICVHSGTVFISFFLILMLLSIACFWPFLGENFFPEVDAGQIKLHMTLSTGTRVEETARVASLLHKIIRRIIPAEELDVIVDNVGLPVSGINLTYNNSATNGPEDADILIMLKPKHKPTSYYTKQLRMALKDAYPSVAFAFLPADIVNQILNFGVPAVIDIQVVGQRALENRAYAKILLKKLRAVKGIVDARIRQADNYPALKINVDRGRAKSFGFTQQDVARNLLLSLSGSYQLFPSFWVDPSNSVSYNVTAQTPEYAMNSLNALANIPLVTKSTEKILGAISTVSRFGTPVVVSHYNVQPVTDVLASIQDRDLGGVAHEITQLLKSMQGDLPKGSQVLLHGQIATQKTAYHALYLGLLFSIVFVYLLIVVNFQSWLDPLIIIAALPAALAGIAWILFITHTTLSVPALIGAIMCMGVATANSILVVSFAKEHLAVHGDPVLAATTAGTSRLRPVMMTALAMILGMLPMALGIGEGAEQNAPLGRAVIGGLCFATVASLFFVPALFARVYRKFS